MKRLNAENNAGLRIIPVPSAAFFYFLFIIKFVQLGTQIKHNVKKRKYTKIHKKYTVDRYELVAAARFRAAEGASSRRQAQ